MVDGNGQKNNLKKEWTLRKILLRTVKKKNKLFAAELSSLVPLNEFEMFLRLCFVEIRHCIQFDHDLAARLLAVADQESHQIFCLILCF